MKALRKGLPIGWQGLRYPGGDPENGPAYLQRWTGEQFVCVEHKFEHDEEAGGEVCKNCYALNLSNPNTNRYHPKPV